jgi:hypothetical protein
MLNQVHEIAAPHPPHILQIFMPLLPKYVDLSVPENFLQLSADICDFVSANPVVWEFKMPTASELVARCEKNTLIDLYSAIYEIHAEQHGATVWCCKSMANLYFIPEIEQSGLRPTYIHLVRDGRDVAASFKRAIVGEKHIYHLARQWREDQERSKDYCDQYAPERYILISYEDLIHDTEATIRKLLDRLGLPFDRTVFDFYKTDEAKHTAEAGKMWDNLVKPVIRTNSNKFLTQLTDEEILIFESIAGGTLDAFGYQRHCDRNALTSSFSDVQIAEFDRLNKEMKAEAISSLDPAGSEKRKAQLAIIERIKARK